MPAVMPDDRYEKNTIFSEQQEWWVDDFNTPSSSDQMIRNLSMKIGEVDSGSTRVNLTNFLKFLIIWSAAITQLEVMLG